eukprot:CAMPEP_0184669274 /NCGR_PEP_ID=MMETSP0308-20130426/76499_1 /TAXON_ID=38269 /ORGANISM="Gloeochaete witrockiana, Strain SAG 46.84" /LENGTH=149 /DNA_ID=CAMNT_0027115449 /DNA_START=53 /DNA_END=502 /DNA_ORIENTATION=-
MSPTEVSTPSLSPTHHVPDMSYTASITPQWEDASPTTTTELSIPSQSPMSPSYTASITPSSYDAFSPTVSPLVITSPTSSMKMPDAISTTPSPSVTLALTPTVTWYEAMPTFALVITPTPSETLSRTNLSCLQVGGRTICALMQGRDNG